MSPSPSVSEHAARLASVAAHPDYPALFAHRPAESLGLGVLGGVGIGALLVVVCVALALFVGSIAGPCLLFPVLLLAAGLLTVAQEVRRGIGLRSGPLVVRPGLVLGGRTEHTSSAPRTGATRHLVTLELEGGAVAEFSASEPVAGDLARGDAGVAYTVGALLVEFRRLAV
jgi:hypothetical protein